MIHGKPKLTICIPARLHSTRLPQKPLSRIGTQTLIQVVVTNALLCARAIEESSAFDQVRVVVATDSTLIQENLQGYACQVVLTDSHLPSGTDRICQALLRLDSSSQGQSPSPKVSFSAPSDWELVLNLQGDEPRIHPQSCLELCLKMLSLESFHQVGTLVYRNHNWDDFFSSQVVKCVRCPSGKALTFTRAPSPWPRDLLGASGKDWLPRVQNLSVGKDVPSTDHPFWHHVGVYCYFKKDLLEFATQLPQGELEQMEGLEQLRALENGWIIHAVETPSHPFGIDTPEDLEKFSKMVLPPAFPAATR